jgi:hypothetical protein
MLVDPIFALDSGDGAGVHIESTQFVDLGDEFRHSLNQIDREVNTDQIRQTGDLLRNVGYLIVVGLQLD